jgi:hypothetical protein
MLAPRVADPVRSQEHHSQRQFCVSATVAMTAAHWILQQKQPLHVFHTEA